MPRTVEEILQHADELSARFEDYEPDPADKRDAPAFAALRSVVAEKARAEREMLDAVSAARQAGASWASIGAVIGTSGEAARQRYAKRVA